jgi:predicted RND superfamily exporter protein
LKVKPRDGNFLAGYVGDLRKLLDSFRWPQTRFHIAGSPVEHYDLIDAIRRDQMVFVPIITVFLILATFLIYRNFPSVVIAMSVVFMTLVWTFGTIALTGRSLNLVNALLAPVVMIIAVTNAIYLINLFSELRHHHRDLRESISLTVAHLGVPCLLTEATIAAGFLSLLLSPVPAVQSFGLFAALGAVYSYVVSIILTPIILPLLPFQERLKVETERHFFNQAVIFYLEKLEFSLKGPLLGGAALLLILSLVGIRGIRVDTNVVRDLPEKSPLAEATRFMDERLAGVYSLGIAIERADGESLGTVEALKKIDALAQFVETQPEITKVNSLVTLVKKIHQARMGSEAEFRIPDEDKTVQDYLEKMAASDNPDFWTFLSRDFRHTRLEARMKAVGTEKGGALEDRIWDYAEKNLGSDYEVRLTGSVVLLGQMSEELVSNQIESLGLAFLVILGLIAFFFRSWKMALLAAIPNLIPIVGLYGLMGFLKIELSTPMAMISSVVLGLVVDASIQFLYRFRHEFERRQHYLQALHHTYRNIGQAMVVTTMILVFGFASSVFASFRPTFYFGILTGLTILFSLVCTLVLLPLALVLMKPFGRPALFGPSSKETLTPKKRSSIIAA